ncbi:MAG: hypothetical protein JXB23_08480 [Candidatus Aminicenantes bacterium]|nr:hypothetical protein [Candidatus Aminicenantes bacterium]
MFFDGVPDPESKEEQTITPTPSTDPALSSEARQRSAVIMISQHPDYSGKKCDRCHDRTSSNYLTADKKAICYSCHKREKFKGAFVHGPVAVGDCLACHHPHESRIKKLLRSEDSDLCFKCHKPELIRQIKDHDREDYLGCSRCHLPHISDNRFFVKDSSI